MDTPAYLQANGPEVSIPADMGIQCRNAGAEGLGGFLDAQVLAVAIVWAYLVSHDRHVDSTV
jgi:hypothetical protein